jgi:hypothetical protein
MQWCWVGIPPRVSPLEILPGVKRLPLGLANSCKYETIIHSISRIDFIVNVSSLKCVL